MKSSPFVLTQARCISFNTVGPGLRRSKRLPATCPRDLRDSAPTPLPSFDVRQGEAHCLPQI
jgi:hypothetical protein